MGVEFSRAFLSAFFLQLSQFNYFKQSHFCINDFATQFISPPATTCQLCVMSHPFMSNCTDSVFKFFVNEINTSVKVNFITNTKQEKLISAHVHDSSLNS